ncbi:MAG: hypothetical protein K940chlam1_00331 [Candidatus Anoxychlamydiales bacterium]|nr:hypothetical protein [Candidatus Anoxychlamydiales bacterium]NGX35280.1 hypothetical protein [Candidatus Anoxychlamydiales bacterium]
MKNLKIVRVNKNNFKDLGFLIRKLAKYLKQDAPDNKAFQRLKKDLIAHHPRCEAYVQTFNDKPIGCVIFYIAYASFLGKPILFLEDLFVLRSKRVQGFGKNLFLFCVEKAKEKKCARMDWRTLKEDRNARNFYEKFGAKSVKKWIAYRLDEKRINSIVKIKK